MFDRIKCWKNIKKDEKILKGFIKMGRFVNDEYVTNIATDSYSKLQVNKRKIILNRKKAIAYNANRLKVFD